LLIADLAAAELLRARDPAAAAACGAAAGLSLGEYAALVWAGAIAFEDAFKASYRVCLHAPPPPPPQPWGSGRGWEGGWVG